jgi:hypothetical protein
MKYLALVLAFLCGSANATNVFYYPIMDQDTGLPNVLYFTDESSSQCPNNMMVARLETDDKKVLNTLCWARDRNNMGNTLLLNLYNGQITSNYIPYGVSKYAGDAYPTLMKKWLAENEAATKVMNSPEFKKRHGLLSEAEKEAAP